MVSGDTRGCQLHPSAGIPVWAGNTGSLEASCQPAGRCVPPQHSPSLLPKEKRESPASILSGAPQALFWAAVIPGAVPAQGCITVPVLHTDVTCDEWSFYLLPLDEDIISMELPEFFRDYFLVSGTLCGGDSPSCPPCLAGAGGTMLF